MAGQQGGTGLNPREKAAVIVRFLLAEGASLPLSQLPDQMQAALTEQIGQMGLVDRRSLALVVEEFLDELEQVGLAFPTGLDGALSVMDGHISATAASRLRRLAGAAGRADPWDRLTALPPDRLLPLLEGESPEVAAVMLSKLPVQKSAEILGRLPGEKARRLAYAMSRTHHVSPDTLRQIGAALAGQLDLQPQPAFDSGPVERVGAILNVAAAATREAVLQGLEEEDAGFAAKVRRAIFTFAHLPQRIAPRDVPKVLRLVDPPEIATALAACTGDAALEAAREFLLAHMSQRMAQGLRDDLASLPRPDDRRGEAAMTAVIAAIRQLQGAGELTLQPEASA